ncbi:MAG: hypothetical protein ACPG5B_09485 [Chitinophagales bacterium]
MFRQQYYPKSIKGEELDLYLEHGWYRSGQVLFTTHLIILEDDVYTPVWTRLPLENYSFKKRLRQLFNKNNKRFRIEYSKTFIDEKKEALYAQHKFRFGKYPPQSLKQYLLDCSKDSIFNSYEVRVYDGDELIAVSFFDIGTISMMSILALYNQTYQKESLGIYTMLLEIDFAQKKELKYYYSGYIVPKYERFDYKLRVGNLEFYDMFDKTWKDYQYLDLFTLPAETMKEKLSIIVSYFDMLQLPYGTFVYRLYDTSISRSGTMNFVRNPMFINCLQVELKYPSLIVEYDLTKKKYLLSWCKELDLQQARYYLVKEKVLLETTDITKLLQTIWQLQQNNKQTKTK